MKPASPRDFVTWDEASGNSYERMDPPTTPPSPPTLPTPTEVEKLQAEINDKIFGSYVGWGWGWSWGWAGAVSRASRLAYLTRGAKAGRLPPAPARAHACSTVSPHTASLQGVP